MTNDDFPCCASGDHEATTNPELAVAVAIPTKDADIARLRKALAQAWLEGAEAAFYDPQIRGFVDYPDMNPYSFARNN